jgi:alcohol dehydrogenase
MLDAERIEIRIPRTLFGIGAVTDLGDLAKGFSPHRILIITDRGVAGAGIIDIVRANLAAAQLEADVFDECGVEAPVSGIEGLVQRVKSGQYDLLVGVGGGSVLDTTKAASILAAHDESSIQDLLEGKPLQRSLPKILIPTTAGTGSEWSIAAVITTDTTDDRTNVYMTPLNLPEAVVIDPALTKDLPARATAHTGMDALAHAIEGYTCCRANFVTDLFAAKAIQLISRSIGPAYAKGCVRMEDRYQMAIGASFAMFAGAVAGVGLAHFMNIALGKRAGISHGAAVGLMLPYSMEYNMVSAPEKFAEVAGLLGENTDGLSTRHAALRSVAAVRALLSDLDMPQRLSEVGLTAADIPILVDELMTYQSFPLGLMNPRDVSAKDATEVYMKAL